MGMNPANEARKLNGMTIPSGIVDVQDSVPDRAGPEEKLTEVARVDGPLSERAARRRFRYTLPGAWVAVVFVCLAFTPSLVPRPGVFQGLVCGISGGDRLRAGCPRRPGVAGVRRPAGTPDPVPIVAGVPDRRADHRADLLRARAAVAGADPGPGDAEPEAFGSKLWLPVVAALLFVGLVAAARGIRHFFWWVAAC